MNEETQLAALLRGGTKTDTGSFLATVTVVNTETIDVMAGNGTEYFDVQLKAAINAKGGMIILPVVGSTVLVNSIEGSNRLYVAMFSEIDKVIFNNGESGMVRIEKLTEKLNEMIDTFNNHQHSNAVIDVIGDGVTKVIKDKSEKPTSEMAKIEQSDYEDEHLKY